MFRNLLPSLVILALAIGGGVVWMQSKTGPDPLLADLKTISEIEEVVDVQASEGVEVIEMTFGDDSAPITIVEYASFTCPHCATYHNGVLPKLKAEYVETGKVKFVVRDIYFDPVGLWAAMVARCDGAEKFFGMSDLIYSRQKEWTKGGDNSVRIQNLRKLGLLAGMTNAQLDVCLADQAKAEALVAEYQKNATTDEIDSTPSFMINGKKYSNMSFVDFKVVLDELLAE